MQSEEDVMKRANLVRISALAWVLVACGSESGGPQSPPPPRGIEGSGVAKQGIQGSGLRTLGIQGTGRNARATTPRAVEEGEGEAGAAWAE